MTAKDKESDIDVGEEAIQRLAGQVFDAPKDLTKAKETVSENKHGDGDGSAMKNKKRRNMSVPKNIMMGIYLQKPSSSDGNRILQ
jgi:hypothetical protein